MEWTEQIGDCDLGALTTKVRAISLPMTLAALVIIVNGIANARSWTSHSLIAEAPDIGVSKRRRVSRPAA
ncbi:hypothetical protein ACFFWD_33965 [Bradyrhizobium erythrophlei]|uniref:hypothetical protein n=1 Tax=Bradyrhizobium erythrophlei TaxID=1437360 RepID=UPI0035EE3DB4